MSQGQLGSVEVGAREIYDAVMRLAATVDRLVDQHDATRTDVADHEVRLRTLERARWPLPSLAVLISAGALLLAVLRPGH